MASLYVRLVATSGEDGRMRRKTWKELGGIRFLISFLLPRRLMSENTKIRTLDNLWLGVEINEIHFYFEYGGFNSGFYS
jgi:hypothetical protein